MKKIAGTFDATGAIINVGLGFIPDSVIIRNHTDAEDQFVTWNRHMRVAAIVAGMHSDGDDSSDFDLTTLAATTGISPYIGGDVIVTAAETHLVRDPSIDKKGGIKTFVIDTAANRTGHFTGITSLPTGVAAGSIISVDRAEQPGSIIEFAVIEAITSDGEADDEVTLSKALASGKIFVITGAFDYIAAAAGVIMPPGFTLAALTNFNVDSDLLAFEAEKWDD